MKYKHISIKNRKLDFKGMGRLFHDIRNNRRYLESFPKEQIKQKVNRFDMIYDDNKDDKEVKP